MGSLKIKRVLITGGSRGIGKAIVETYLKEGYQVAFTYKSRSADAAAVCQGYDAATVRRLSLWI